MKRNQNFPWVGTQKRGQSEVLGFVLLFSIILLGAVTIVALGASSIGDVQQDLSVDRAEQTMTQLNSKAALVAFGQSDTQQVSLPSRDSGEYSVNPDDGWINVTAENESGDQIQLVNATMGTITYDNNGDRVAYQGGGVWRGSDAGGSMVSPPEFHYRDETLTLPTVNITGDEHVSGEVTITHEETTKAFPEDPETSTLVNPLEDRKVNITVQSEFYLGWAEYFEERTTSQVTINEDEQKVIVTLVPPPEPVEIDGAFTVDGVFGVSGGGVGEIESYDSSTNTGPSTGGGDLFVEDYDPADSANFAVDGDIYIDNRENDIRINDDFDHSDVGSIYVTGNITIDVNNGGGGPPGGGGNGMEEDTPEIKAGGDIDVQNGDLSNYDDEDIQALGEITGTSHGQDNLDQIGEIDTIVEYRDMELSATGVINDLDTDEFEEINEVNVDETITEGDYILDVEGDDFGGHFEFDTSEGEINLLIEGDLAGVSAEVVDGDERVNVYVTGEADVAEWASIDGGDASGGPGIDSDYHPRGDQLFLYAVGDFEISGGDEFNGVIVTDGGFSGSGNAKVLGAVIADDQSGQGGTPSVYFDEALEDVVLEEIVTEFATITYLHISEAEITVD